jgi:hypothetical protein
MAMKYVIASLIAIEKTMVYWYNVQYDDGLVCIKEQGEASMEI